MLSEIAELCSKGDKIVLVHGGAFFVNEVMESMGLKPVFVKSPSGIVSRYTDLKTLQCYVMAMMWVNKLITSKLQRLGVNAVGLSGPDAKLLLAKRKDKIVIVDERGRERVIDGGFTGKIVDVNVDLINMLVERDMVPVVAPVAYGGEGSLLNVDSDQVAYSISVKWRPDRVIVLLDVDGLIIGGRVVNRLRFDEALEMVRSPEVTGGMRRKLYLSAQIAREGIPVVITNGLIERPVQSSLRGLGTHILP